MSYQILVTSRSFGSTSPDPARILAKGGCSIVKPPAGIELDEKGMIEALAGADGLIVGNEPVTAAVMAASPKLRVVSKHGIGVDNIDLSAARRQGIIVTNAPGANSCAVAELAITLMHTLARNVLGADRQARSGSWKPVVGSQLTSKTLGLVGMGRIGKIVIQRLSGYEMNFLAYDPIRDEAFAERFHLRYCDLDQLVREADIISLHAPLVSSTRGIIGATQIGLMKPSAILVNTARGELVDETALYQALRNRKIAGAGLDVFAQEPPKANPLLGLDNVVVTPHIGAHTFEAIAATSTVAAENTVAALTGGVIPHQVIEETARP